MNKLAILITTCATLVAGSLAVAKDKPVYFEYDEFAAIRDLDPNMQEARLCGMNKYCMKLWKHGDMMATEHGMVVRADFDGDGTVDVGVAMEKDKPGAEEKPEIAENLDYFMMCATKKDGKLRLLETVPLTAAHTVVEALWDAKKKGISIDTGERQLTTQSTVTVLGDGKLIGGLSKKTGEVEMRLTFLFWDAKNKKFDLTHGSVKI